MLRRVYKAQADDVKAKAFKAEQEAKRLAAAAQAEADAIAAATLLKKKLLKLKLKKLLLQKKTTKKLKHNLVSDYARKEDCFYLGKIAKNLVSREVLAY
jgi:hypothetical protein